MATQGSFDFDEPEQPKKVMRALSELPTESAEEVQKAKEKAKERAILREAETKAEEAKQTTRERNKAAKAGQGTLDLSGAEEARAKLSKMAEEHRVTAKDERTYKRFGEPVTRGGGAMPKSNRDITKNYKAGGKVRTASQRADGCCIRGKTRA
jgi:hypothetical protein